MKNFDLNLFILIMFLLNFFLIFIMIIPSNLYNFHPLTLMMLLVLYTIILTLKLNFLMSSYWYSYILFLVMIGGLMILFMYFTSLTNNQLFYFSKNYNFFLIMKFLFLLIYLSLMIYYLNNYSNFFYSNFIELNEFINYFLTKDLNLFKNLMMDYSMDMNLYMIMYLFFTMICSVLICTKTKIPLRQIMKY